MSKIYRRSDRIVVKIDDITVKLSPLTLHEKVEINSQMLRGSRDKNLKELSEGLALAIRYALKDIDGLEDSDGSPYKLQFADDGGLTPQCIDDLMNIEATNKLALVCSSMINGVPSQFTDEHRNALAGVELVTVEKADPEKKN